MVDEDIRALEREAKAGDPRAKEQLQRVRARAGIPETAAEVLEEVDAKLEVLRNAQGKLRDDGEKDLERYLESIFRREPGVQVITIRGYTPGFLDGDLCEHSQSVTIGDPDRGGSCANAAVYERGLGELEMALHFQHGTNWQIEARFDDETLTLEVEPYESGY